MKYPNLRYGNPTELAYYAMCLGDDLPRLARILRRDERTVRDWLTCRAKVPWWVPEILRLKQMEAAEIHRQMGFAPQRAKLGIVGADIVDIQAAATSARTSILSSLRSTDSAQRAMPSPPDNTPKLLSSNIA